MSDPPRTLGLMDVMFPLLALISGLLIGALGALLWAGRRPTSALPAVSGPAPAVETALIRDGLDRLHEKMRDLEHQRSSWQGILHQQVDEVRHSTDTLRRETSALATALRKPQVRGQWGELHLRRAVELAGLVEHCDFAQQVHLVGSDGDRDFAQRPDLVVRLAGGRSIAVDAKVPLAAHLDALATEDPDEHATAMGRHARHLRTHIDQLSAKGYWRALPESPEFVVLFVPAESSLAAALEAQSDLLDYAAARNVVLASPTTLIALLRTVAHGWTTAALAERTREIHQLGRDLHTRLGTVGRHLDKLGRSLKGSVEAYNSAVGSLEQRVLVTARHFSDVAEVREELPTPQPVTETARPLTAPELLEARLFEPEDRRGEPPAGYRSAGLP